jgi:hypothetical protein
MWRHGASVERLLPLEEGGWYSQKAQKFAHRPGDQRLLIQSGLVE